MIMFIQEYYTGKIHKRTMKCGSCQYEVEGHKWLVVRDYWTGKICHKYNVEKYGSIRYWAEEQDED
jgi:hypothetical protein